MPKKIGGFSRDPGSMNEAVYGCGWEWSLEEELITSMPLLWENAFIAKANFGPFFDPDAAK